MQVTFTGRGLEVTDAMKQFITEKLEKLPNTEAVLHTNCEVGQEVAHKGVEKDFYIRILVTLPKAVIRIKKEGPEVYALLDEMLPRIQKKMVQYKDNRHKWEGREIWPEATFNENDDSASAVYAGYEPKVRRKVVTEMPPMSIREAIERMELLDKSVYLFKDVQTGKVAVITRDAGNYEVLIAS